MGSGWIGVDFDGTLAEYHGWDNGKIGAPIPMMVERVKGWIAEHKDVRIFTARVSLVGHTMQDVNMQRTAIQDWCLEHLGLPLPVTCEKDLGMVELWDDRCHPVELNTGRDRLEVQGIDGLLMAIAKAQSFLNGKEPLDVEQTRDVVNLVERIRMASMYVEALNG